MESPWDRVDQVQGCMWCAVEWWVGTWGGGRGCFVSAGIPDSNCNGLRAGTLGRREGLFCQCRYSR